MFKFFKSLRVEIRNQSSWNYVQLLPMILPSIGTREEDRGFFLSFVWLKWAFVLVFKLDHGEIAPAAENDVIAAAVTLLESKGFEVAEPLTKGLRCVAAERRRQIREEGFSAEHDQLHVKNELLYAALCYLDPSRKYEKAREGGVFFGGTMTTEVPTVTLEKGPEGPGQYFVLPRQFWPFDIKWWKPCPNNRRREIIKGLALGVAYLDQQLEQESKTEKIIEDCCGAM
jgi:hypothetical protein